MIIEERIRRGDRHRMYYSRTAKLYFEEGLGYERISKIIPVCKTTIKNWCITFAKENGLQMGRRITGLGAFKKDKPSSGEGYGDIKALQAEVKRLGKELIEEKLRAEAYDTMITIAESKFNIPIRKKVGAKR